jgi:hypothetical protein
LIALSELLYLWKHTPNRQAILDYLAVVSEAGSESETLAFINLST